jgi:hypothetical protein
MLPASRFNAQLLAVAKARKLLFKRFLALGICSTVVLVSTSCSQSKPQNSVISSASSTDEEGKRLGYSNYYLGMSLSQFYERKLPKSLDRTVVPKLIQETDPDSSELLGCSFEGAYLPPFAPDPNFVFYQSTSKGKSILVLITGEVPLADVDSAVELVSKSFGKPTEEHPLNSLGKVKYAWEKNGCVVSLVGDVEEGENANLSYFLMERKDDMLRAVKNSVERRDERLAEESRKSRVTAASSEESDEERKEELEAMNDGLVPDYEEDGAPDWQLPMKQLNSISSQKLSSTVGVKAGTKSSSDDGNWQRPALTPSQTSRPSPAPMASPYPTPSPTPVSSKMPMTLPNSFAAPSASARTNASPVPASVAIGKVGATAAPSPTLAGLPSSYSDTVPAPNASVSTHGTYSGGGAHSPIPVLVGGGSGSSSTEHSPIISVGHPAAPVVPRESSGSSFSSEEGKRSDFEIQVRMLPQFKGTNSDSEHVQFLVTAKNCTETKIMNSFSPSVSVTDEFGNSYSVSRTSLGSKSRDRRIHPGEENECSFKILDRILPKARNLTVYVSPSMFAKSQKFSLSIE